MSGFGRKEEIEAALGELGRQMVIQDAGHLAVLCCGAAALCALDVLDNADGEQGERDVRNSLSESSVKSVVKNLRGSYRCE